MKKFSLFICSTEEEIEQIQNDQDEEIIFDSMSDDSFFYTPLLVDGEDNADQLFGSVSFLSPMELMVDTDDGGHEEMKTPGNFFLPESTTCH